MRFVAHAVTGAAVAGIGLMMIAGLYAETHRVPDQP